MIPASVRPLFLVACLAAFPSASSAVPRPNLVVFLADDLGWQDLGCYGGPVKTPTLDALAAGGTRFTDFYSGCAVCSPSRATLLTGRHHIRTGVYSWISDAGQRSHLLEREITLAELLKAQGYATAHVGKWHLGLPTERFAKPTPDQHGFDHWFATWNNAEPSHRNPATFIRNGEPVGEIEGYSCQIVVDEAIAWLDAGREKDQPFFLNVWFHEPHAPIAAPDEIVSEYGELKNKNAIYSATIANTDRAIARLLAKVKEVAPAEDTLVVYFSDNGSYLRDRVGHLRGAKGTNWDGGIRVPGIFSWPGKIEAGTVESTPAGLVDLLPTVCGLFGFEPPAGVHLDGSDLAPILEADSRREFARHQPLYWHLQKSRPIVALRDGRWSLTADPDYELSTDNLFQEKWIPAIKSGGYTNWQLFDLESDPSQEKNVAGQNPEVLERLKEKLLEINASVMADGADWHLPPNP
jgi:arylsulfatase A